MLVFEPKVQHCYGSWFEEVLEVAVLVKSVVFTLCPSLMLK